MSNVASPRPSLSIRSPSIVSSTRTSLDIPTSSPVSALRAGNTNRRNRAALRDYYNLKNTAPADATISTTEVVEKGPLSELDAPSFEAGAFVKGLLEKEGLEGILKVESMLVGQIKGLDGERKALVYDNYSRLIEAAGTIQKMRSNIDPMTPTTSTLAPAVAHIVDTAGALSKNVPRISKRRTQDQQGSGEADAKKQTVRWVLAAPDRLEELLAEGKREEAQQDWKEVKSLLEAWSKVPGAAELQERCEAVMADSDHDDDHDDEG